MEGIHPPMVANKARGAGASSAPTYQRRNAVSVRYIVDRAGQVREGEVVGGRVPDFKPGSDRFHFADKADADAKATELLALLEGKAVTRG